ncbi:MAG: T9SS type A sorting domain-containing protein, partial [Bacteroidota bacterium]
ADTLLNSQEAYYGDHGATGVQALQGYQDLGCKIIQNATQWKHILSGDGSYTWISKQNPDFGYISDYGADMYRVDHLTTTPTFTAILNQLDTDNDGHVDDGTMFTHPFIMNNANDSQLYIPTFHWLWRSTDRGNNWIQVSHRTGNSFTDVSASCTHKPNPIVYWTNSDSVFVFANAATALPLSEFGRPVPFDAARCYADPDHDSALYVIHKGAPQFSYCANLFNPNSSWTPIPVTLLSGLTIQCIAVYPGNDQIILAGSKEGGLYITLNRGLTWTKEISMPNVQITEIKIRASDKKVFIFTYGRGTWTADFASVVSVTPTQSIPNVSVYPNPFRDQMTIEFERELNAIVELTDMQGKQCLKKSVSGKQIKINTSDLVSGLYIITVSESNKILYQTKGIRIGK